MLALVVMARPKEFERDAALDSAIAIFCDHGFEGTCVCRKSDSAILIVKAAKERS
jgi:hypothetical protein